jgi:cyclopropane fatty-acyl-phospholipid synthase-like methyltransferase
MFGVMDMEKENMKDYQTLVEFWNKSYQFEQPADEQSDVDAEVDYLTLAPSQKLFGAAELLGKKACILDYGCGSGWASIIIAKSGGQNITSVEVIPNGCKMTSYYARAFKVQDNIHLRQIDENWLEKQPSNTYDGIFCSNVVDVVPQAMAETIVCNLGRVLTEDGCAIISLNFYMDRETAKTRGLTVVDNQIYINGVLRLLSLTDEEWTAIIEKYFVIERLEYFAWPGEQKETRRLFYLRKKNNA